MELFPEEIKDKTPRVGKTDRRTAEEIRVPFKLFSPLGGGTWYVVEANFDEEDMPAFGYVTGLGEDELGHFSLKELSELVLPFGQKIERDVNWDPETTLRNVMDGRVR